MAREKKAEQKQLELAVKIVFFSLKIPFHAFFHYDFKHTRDEQAETVEKRSVMGGSEVSVHKI